MPQPNDGMSPSQQARIRELFDRAQSLPPAQREAFVRREAAGDAGVCERVLALLQAGAIETAKLLAGLHAPPSSEPSASRDADPTTGPAGDRVHATATDELMAKLAKAPKLDTARFVVEGDLGQGGMGAVYRIHDQHLNRRLAIKVLLDRGSPQDREEEALAHQLLGRFLEEAQVSSQLDHPGVVPVHELGLDHEGKVWFTMRMVKGRTASAVFADAYAQSDGWTLTRGLEVVLKVCDTMAYAHEKGVLHRDLKPSNVMVGKFGEVYVMDWGLAKVVGQADRHDVRIRPEGLASSGASKLDTARKRDAEHDTGSSVVTMDGAKLGTPSYMPPEQARGEVATLDVRADVYAIGAMVYELVTGRAPYVVPGVRKPAYRILDDVADGPPKAIEEIQKGVPAELVAIVKKAMAREREQRYPDTAALAADLRAFLGSQVVSAYRTGALVELRLWVRRNKPLAASLLAAMLILVVGIVGMTWLANENAALAVAETKAKDDALVQRQAALEQKQRADEAAAANEKLAKSESEAKVAATQLAAENGALAESEGRAKSEAQRTVSNFNQLAGVLRLKDVLARQDELWPAGPDKVEALQGWLDNDCAQLLAMRPQIEATIAELRSKAVPLTAAQVEADRRAAAEWPAFDRQQQLVAALRRAQAIRGGTAQLELPELPPTLREADASALNSFAWPRVAPEKPDGEKQDRTTFGEEALALVAARAAVAKAVGKPEEFQFLDTLAWAAVANGQDAEAKQRTAEALAKAPAAEREAYLGRQRDIESESSESAARLATAETKLATLDAQVSVRRTWTFGDDAESESARFLHDALVGVLAGVNSMAAKERADVAQRLTWAQQVRAASLAHPKARVTWAAAREAIATADDVVASTRYAGVSMPLPDEAVIGLVPIGMNPVTKLWEFYDLRSAWDGKQTATEIAIPTHKEDSSIEVKAGTGIVFVLLPGGKVTLGSQNDDKDEPFYDPQSRNDETLHDVTLSPFFLARHELTQGQWSRLWTWDAELRAPSQYKAGANVAGAAMTLANPVEQVDWPMCDRLLTRHGLVLPTEAQWEYGCRGGTTTAWNVELTELKTVANLASQDAKPYGVSWTLESWRDGHAVHAPVGTYAANAFGLYDVHGNVGEWCRDWYGDYGSERAGDGLRSVSSPAYRVNRGGGFSNAAVSARSAIRGYNAPSFRFYLLGLRPARLITY